MKREYNEVFGWMPTEIINHLSEIDRQRMFVDWIRREPTPTGWIIVDAVVEKLGDGFLEYLFDCICETMDEPLTRESITENLHAVLEAFASDINLLYEFVDNYQEEREDSQIPVEISGTVQEAEDAGKQPRDAKGRFVKKQK